MTNRHGLPLPTNDLALPAPDERLVARIVALDGTWHRTFTTLELAALQSLFDPRDIFVRDPAIDAYVRRRDHELARRSFDLGTCSDSGACEWIGNAVPGASAKAMAEVIGEALLLGETGESFTLSSREIWVRPLAMALAVDPGQPAFDLDRAIAA